MIVLSGDAFGRRFGALRPGFTVGSTRHPRREERYYVNEYHPKLSNDDLRIEPE